jgi:hypothetical protein
MATRVEVVDGGVARVTVEHADDIRVARVELLDPSGEVVDVQPVWGGGPPQTGTFDVPLAAADRSGTWQVRVVVKRERGFDAPVTADIPVQ